MILQEIHIKLNSKCKVLLYFHKHNFDSTPSGMRKNGDIIINDAYEFLMNHSELYDDISIELTRLGISLKLSEMLDSRAVTFCGPDLSKYNDIITIIASNNDMSGEEIKLSLSEFITLVKMSYTQISVGNEKGYVINEEFYYRTNITFKNDILEIYKS